jgi:hypothetical protein
MSFDPTKPVEDSPLDAAEMRDQFNGLKAIIDDLQARFTLLVPVINRSAGGMWTLTYHGPTQDYWQLWMRCQGTEAWSNFGELETSSFPAPDADIIPDGTPWWQIKLCGENADGKPVTPFSNIISFGPVP